MRENALSKRKIVTWLSQNRKKPEAASISDQKPSSPKRKKSPQKSLTSCEKNPRLKEKPSCEKNLFG
jgi:hypothetical protein